MGGAFTVEYMQQGFVCRTCRDGDDPTPLPRAIFQPTREALQGVSWINFVCASDIIIPSRHCGN